MNVLTSGRNAAESRFTETLVFFQAASTVDDSTLLVTTVEAAAATVPGRIKVQRTLGQDAAPGTQSVVVTRLEAHVAVGAYDAAPGCWVRVTASTSDDALVGRVFRVAEPHTAGQVTAWRYPVTEVTSG